MYLVNKAFANNKISASKGKVIDIKDKSLASALESAGFISPYSEKAMTNKEMEKTIKDLTKQLNDKDSEIQTLKDKIADLEKELELKEKLTAEDENKDNLDEGNTPDTNNGAEPNEEDKTNSETTDVENKGNGSNLDEESKDKPKTDKK